MFEQFKRWVSELSGGKAQAIHAVSGNNHAVAILSMRVIIASDGPDTWFAQSLDIDYAASGLSVEDVKKNFELGLSATIKAHLESFGNIDRIMRSPPIEDWLPLLSKDADQFDFSMQETHLIDQSVLSQQFPYKEISYIQPSRKAA